MQPEAWQWSYFWLCWFSRCVKFSMLYEEKTLREKQKEMCESWEANTKRNWGRGRTSLQAKCVSHTLSSCPPSPVLWRVFLPHLSASGTSNHLLPLWQGLCRSYHIPFSYPSVAFIIPYPSTTLTVLLHIWVLQLSPIRSSIFLIVTSSQYEELCASVCSSTTPSVECSDNKKGKKKAWI